MTNDFLTFLKTRIAFPDENEMRKRMREQQVPTEEEHFWGEDGHFWTNQGEAYKRPTATIGTPRIRRGSRIDSLFTFDEVEQDKYDVILLNNSVYYFEPFEESIPSFLEKINDNGLLLILFTRKALEFETIIPRICREANAGCTIWRSGRDDRANNEERRQKDPTRFFRSITSQ